MHMRANGGSQHTIDATPARSHSLVAIHLAVYVRRGLLPEVSSVQTAHVACGVGDILGNKGGVGVSLCVGCVSDTQSPSRSP